MKKRTIIVGDVHGCFEELQALLQQLSYSQSVDRLIFVGDLIHKGPYSLKVLELAHSVRAEVTLGNHETAFLEGVRSGVFKTENFKDLYNAMGAQKKFWVDWIEALPTYIESEDFMVVHAGLQPGKHPKDTDARILTTIRTWDGRGEDLNREGDPAWFEFYHGRKLVVFGHWASQGLLERPNVVGLDTGCVYGRQLSALVLPERTIQQVQALKAYSPIRKGAGKA